MASSVAKASITVPEETPRHIKENSAYTRRVGVVRIGMANCVVGQEANYDVAICCRRNSGASGAVKEGRLMRRLIARNFLTSREDGLISTGGLFERARCDWRGGINVPSKVVVS